MPDDDRRRWDERYLRGEHTDPHPSPVLTDLDPWLPRRGRALDAAGGAGRHALWLARRGLDVTLADLSPVAIQIAARRAVEEGLSLQTVLVDLEVAPPPDGPWDLIVDFHFLHRPLLPQLVARVAPGGLLVVVQPTVRNLERQSRPSAAYLLAPNELRTYAGDLEIVRYVEDWTVEDRHEAVLVARRPTTE